MNLLRCNSMQKDMLLDFLLTPLQASAVFVPPRALPQHRPNVKATIASHPRLFRSCRRVEGQGYSRELPRIWCYGHKAWRTCRLVCDVQYELALYSIRELITDADRQNAAHREAFHSPVLPVSFTCRRLGFCFAWRRPIFGNPLLQALLIVCGLVGREVNSIEFSQHKAASSYESPL